MCVNTKEALLKKINVFYLLFISVLVNADSVLIVFEDIFGVMFTKFISKAITTVVSLIPAINPKLIA